MNEVEVRSIQHLDNLCISNVPASPESKSSKRNDHISKGHHLTMTRSVIPRLSRSATTSPECKNDLSLIHIPGDPRGGSNIPGIEAGFGGCSPGGGISRSKEP